MTVNEMRSLRRRRATPLWASAGFILASTVVLLLVFGTSTYVPAPQIGAALIQP